MNQKVVVVTGSNKGIGYGIIETLLEKKSKLRIILSSRNEVLGKKSFEELLSKYPESKDTFYYHQLDITKEESIKNFADWAKEKFGKIDYLINNAGVATHGDAFNIDVCKQLLKSM